MKSLYPSVGLNTLCRLFGLSRQAYYAFIKRAMNKDLHDVHIVEMVKSVRRVHPRMGARKIYQLIKPELEQHNIRLGRDKLFCLLSENQLLIRKRKRRVTTTNSYHHYYKYKNLIQGFTPYKSNQLWVSDITYVKTVDGFSFLFLITDAYSKKIVGYKLARTLEAVHAVGALEMAINNVSNREGLIHHSDRGIQYCCNEYVKKCQDYHIQISMTERGNPTDNSIAERVNGILKNEYIHELKPCDYKTLVKHVDVTIYKYNQLRPHMSCDMLTPNAAHVKTGHIKKRWKNYYAINRQEQQ